MAKKWTKDYAAYRQKYYAEKKRGNIKQYQTVFSQKEFRTAKKEGFTGYQILKSQKILKTKAEEAKVWREYKKIRKEYSRGETIDAQTNYFIDNEGTTREEDLELRYHYNLSGLLNDRKALHFMITYRIQGGEERKEVLADYGY